MNPTQDPKKRRKSTKVRREEIVEAAMRIIALQGSRKFTASLVASKVGVTPGAIFRHFATMDDIVVAIVERIEAILFEGLPHETEDPMKRLKAFFRGRVHTILANPLISHLMLSDHLAQAAGPAQAKRLDEFKLRSRTFVINSLRDARQDGTLAGDISPEAGAVIVLGSILSLSHASARFVRKAETERLRDEVWEAIERTLLCEHTSEGRGKQARRQRRRRRSQKE